MYNRENFQEISLFGIPSNEQLNTECTNPDLAVNDAMDGMNIFNGVFKFHDVTNADTVKEDEVWLDNLLEQQG